MSDSLLNKLLDAAEAHGAQSEPDHEVGDLQDILRTCWRRLNSRSQQEVYKVHKDLIDDWK
jgi:hypothetical protein